MAFKTIRLGRLLWGTDWVSRRSARQFAEHPNDALPDARPAARFTKQLSVIRNSFAGWPVWTLQSQVGNGDPERIIVYLHGGGYVGQIGGLQWGWITGIARRTQARVVVPIYPLAPRGTAGTVVPIAADLVSQLIDEYGADAVGLVGDSAGGGLAMAVVLEQIRRGADAPGRLTLISPWLDVTISDPASANIDDPLLGAVGLRAAGKLWGGGLDPKDPLLSPLFGSLAGLPPTVVYSGTRDILSPDTERLRARSLRENAPITFTILDGLVHTWSLVGFLPETKQAQAGIEAALVGTPMSSQ